MPKAKKPAPRPRRTPEQETAVIEGLLEGLSLRAIAERANISHQTVANWLKEDAFQARFGEARTDLRHRVGRRIEHGIELMVDKLIERVPRMDPYQLIQGIQTLSTLSGAGTGGGELDQLRVIFERVDRYEAEHRKNLKVAVEITEQAGPATAPAVTA